MKHAFRTALALTLCTVMSPAVASAQSRTWVSGVGDDDNPCSRTAPCKTFFGALATTAPGGEISALDPGGFGPLTIGQSVTISGDGTLASILAASGGNAVTIDGVGVVVTLRNISLMCTTGLCLKGVQLLNGAALIVDHVTISGFETGVATSAGNAMVVNSTIVRNSGFGVRAMVGTITVENSTVSHNGVGVQAETGASVNLANNGIYSNLTGFGCGGGSLATDGKNRKGNNGGGAVGSCAPDALIPLK